MHNGLFLLRRKEAGARWKSKNFGNPLFVALRARRACITQYRSLSAALSPTMHVGATPSGPEPSGKNSNIFTVGNAPICRVRTPKSVISPPYAATIWEFSERGSRGKTLLQKGFPPDGPLSESHSCPTNGANPTIHCAKRGSPRPSSKL